MYMVLTFWESAQERVELRFTHDGGTRPAGGFKTSVAGGACHRPSKKLACLQPSLHMMRSHKNSNVGESVIGHVVEN